MDLITPFPGLFLFFVFLTERILFWRLDIIYWYKAIPPILAMNGFDGVVFWTWFWTTISFFFLAIPSLWVPSWGSRRYPYFVLWNKTLESIFPIRDFRYLYKHTYLTTISILFLSSLIHTYCTIPLHVIKQDILLTFPYLFFIEVYSSLLDAYIYYGLTKIVNVFLLFSFDLFIQTLVLLFLFYLFAFSSPIFLLLLLILIIIHFSIMLFLSSVEFFALVLIIVYAGAISILFLFVIMLLNLKNDFFIDFKISHILFGFFLTWFLTTALNSFFNEFVLFFFIQPSSNKFVSSDMTILNSLLYDKYGFFLIIVGYILLLTLVGVISILIGL